MIHMMTSTIINNVDIHTLCAAANHWITPKIVIISELNPLSGGNPIIAHDHIKKLTATHGIYLISHPRCSISNSPVLSITEPAERKSKLLKIA